MILLHSRSALILKKQMRLERARGANIENVMTYDQKFRFMYSRRQKTFGAGCTCSWLLGSQLRPLLPVSISPQPVLLCNMPYAPMSYFSVAAKAPRISFLGKSTNIELMIITNHKLGATVLLRHCRRPCLNLE